MLEMLKSRKEQLQAQGKKGFTLMEMLIVIAIIAILIAIAIPVFTAQLNNSKHATDESNARAIYSIAMADYMDNNTYDNDYSAATSISGEGTAVVKVKEKPTDTTTVNETFKFSDVNGTFTLDISNGAPKVTLTATGFDTVNFPQTASTNG